MKRLSKPQATKWTNALRSGKYKKTAHKLQDGTGFCCLGVLCKIMVNKPVLRISGALFGGSLNNQNLAICVFSNYILKNVKII